MTRKYIDMGECPWCDVLEKNYKEVWFTDNHGGEEPLEKHCIECGYNEDSITGELRNKGALSMLRDDSIYFDKYS
mgnify:CR=1 FL=1